MLSQRYFLKLFGLILFQALPIQYFNYFIAANCIFPTKSQLRLLSCTASCTKQINIFKNTVSNGNCDNDNCTEGAVVLIHLFPKDIDCFGSVYLQCTENGWLTPPPIHEAVKSGKYNIIKL